MIQVLVTVDTVRRAPTLSERIHDIVPKSHLSVRSEVMKAENTTTHEEQLVQGIMAAGRPVVLKGQIEAVKASRLDMTFTVGDLAEGR